MHIAVIGGTGREGQGLAIRWARAGHRVTIGSRDPSRGVERARELSRIAGREIGGGDHLQAMDGAEVLVLSVPYAAHRATLETLAEHLGGRVLVDITVPLRPPRVRTVHLPPGRAAALEAQEIAGERARVAATLHHVSAVHLADPDRKIDCDVLVCADDREAMETAMTLVSDLGLRALDAGPLANAVALESLTPVLLHLNRRYRSPGAGIRITGL